MGPAMEPKVGATCDPKTNPCPVGALSTHIQHLTAIFHLWNLTYFYKEGRLRVGRGVVQDPAPQDPSQAGPLS